MKEYLANWNIVRFVRLFFGVIITVQAVQTGQWFLVGLGALLTLMPLLNVGCCGAGGCEVPQRKSGQTHKSKEITYEEVK